jgi:hypothetical protein
MFQRRQPASTCTTLSDTSAAGRRCGDSDQHSRSRRRKDLHDSDAYGAGTAVAAGGHGLLAGAIARAAARHAARHAGCRHVLVNRDAALCSARRQALALANRTVARAADAGFVRCTAVPWARFEDHHGEAPGGGVRGHRVPGDATPSDAPSQITRPRRISLIATAAANLRNDDRGGGARAEASGAARDEALKPALHGLLRSIPLRRLVSTSSGRSVPGLGRCRLGRLMI